MGNCLSYPFSDRSYKPKITKSVRLQRELARVMNRNVELLERLNDIWVRIEQVEQEKENRKKTQKLRKLRQIKKEARQAKRQQDLFRRHELLLKVINKRLHVENLDTQLAEQKSKVNTFWVVKHQVESKVAQRNLRENLRRTRSCNDIHKVVLAFPPLLRNNEAEPSIWLTDENSAKELDDTPCSSSMERIMRLNGVEV